MSSRMIVDCSKIVVIGMGVLDEQQEWDGSA